VKRVCLGRRHIFGGLDFMTIKFKGADLDGDLERIIPHVAAAEEYGGALQHLQSTWDNLTLLGQLSGAGTDMSETRRAFSELAGGLLNQLGREALKKCLQDHSAKAQVAINILVRNLFERTADIGFLSSDEEVRSFLRKKAAGHDADLGALRKRFGEYIRKYSVYSDIIVLDPTGHVLARYDDTVPVTVSRDPAIRAALDTSAAYVESFRETDLVAGGQRSLIYSFRVTDANGSVLGVLCLCFRFEDEAKLIFSNLIGAEDWSVITIMDDTGTVIASSDPFHIPAGVKLAPVLDAEYKIVRFGPMEYIAVSRAAQPYQGYGGPGWYGHLMVPLLQAFNDHASKALAAIDTSIIERVIHSSQLFNDDIRVIPSKANHIQRELNRSVWNGDIKQGSSSGSGTTAFSKILLKEISSTGAKTKAVFESAISDLHETVVTSLLHDNKFHAGLAIDIMDRNLYERANDCRWWALTSAFAEALAQGQSAERDVSAIGPILRTINGLYTVYSNLIVFDRSGRIVAMSNATTGGDLTGTILTDEWVTRILSLRSDQAYAVSSFEETALYEGRATYIYGAAIQDSRRQGVVGGIAIVFDGAPQFAAMLTDALPRDGTGTVKNGAFGLLVERQGRIIACTNDDYRSGETLAIDPAFLSLSPGSGHSGFTVMGDSYYAVGAKASSGYREYKSANDHYHNDVTALVFTRICDAAGRISKPPVKALSIRSDRTLAGDKESVATFTIGNQMFAVRARDIVEAIDDPALVPLPLMQPGMKGCFIYDRAAVPVFDLAQVLDNAAGADDERASTQLAIMVTSSGARFGLVVDALGEIAEVFEERLTMLPAMVSAAHTFADAALALTGVHDNDFIIVLNTDRLYASLSSGTAVADAA
jgi:chemotaxis signal transduction protein